MKKLETAYPGRGYALDIDRDYVPGSDAGAVFEFGQLKDRTDAYLNWVRFVADYPNAAPAVQYRGLNQTQILTQIRRIQDLGKTFCIRILLKELPPNLPEIVDALNAIGTSDYFIVLEGGWHDNVLLLAAQMSGVIAGELSRLDADVPFVISATSMRISYADIEGTKTDGFTNRALLQQLSRSHNNRRFVYGDWGSTRPRRYERASTPLPRIDYPLRDAWLFARSKAKSWTYREAAEIIVGSPEWQECFPMGIWGEEMIRGAARGGALAVNTVQKNIAARVNIHLHKQAYYDRGNYRMIDLDEPWVDL
jgi:hypothetical protein